MHPGLVGWEEWLPGFSVLTVGVVSCEEKKILVENSWLLLNMTLEVNFSTLCRHIGVYSSSFQVHNSLSPKQCFRAMETKPKLSLPEENSLLRCLLVG